MKYLFFLLLLPLSACSSGGSYVELGSQTFHVEVRDDAAGRQMGLMYREEMADDQGMWFVFEEEKPLSFWMKNTLLPLDILYFDNNMELVSIQKNVPPCRSTRCPSYPSEGPARYVLEINAGLSDRFSFQAGMKIAFYPGGPR